MRAPQYGHNRSKRRGMQAPKPPVMGRLWRAVGLRGPNQPLPSRTIRYLKPRDVQYENGAFGAACTLTLWHKSAIKDGVKDSKLAGPTVTKRWAAVKNSHNSKGLG